MIKRINSGFTIVELLVVIVVIAILAVISVVAYTGIQNRANDTAVQSDLNIFAKKIHLASADTGLFPAGGATRLGGVSTGDSTSFPNFKLAPSKSAYYSTAINLFYSTGIETASGQRVFYLYARSKSGNLYKYSSNGGLVNLGNTDLIVSFAYQGLNEPSTWSYAYHTTNGWYSWTN